MIKYDGWRTSCAVKGATQREQPIQNSMGSRRRRGLLSGVMAMTMAIAAGAVAQDGDNVEATGPKGPLRGTMVLTARDAPIILMIPGSGPTDRDGNSPLGVHAAPYRLLTEGLAAAGISSVRIDKRGLFGSQTAVLDANAVTIADYVQDIAAWVDAIRARTGAQCVWLLGHSEGGLVALASAAEVDHLCGLILVATAGRPLGEVIKEQLHSNDANAALMEAADHVINELTAGRRVDVSKIPSALSPLFNPTVQSFLVSTFALDPGKLRAELNYQS
jgi:uncharacterized protein